MAPKCGTSGLRCIVTELSEAVVQAYTRSFLGTLATVLHVGHDLRASSQEIDGFVASAATAPAMI